MLCLVQAFFVMWSWNAPQVQTQTTKITVYHEIEEYGYGRVLGIYVRPIQEVPEEE